MCIKVFIYLGDPVLRHEYVETLQVAVDDGWPLVVKVGHTECNVAHHGYSPGLRQVDL